MTAQKELIVSSSALGSSIFVLDFYISNEQNLLCILTSESSAIFYELGQYDKPYFEKKFYHLQENLFFLESENIWITSDIHRTVKGWKFETFPEVKFEEEFSFTAHSDKVSGIVLVKDIGMYVTCSLDGAIRFWQERTFSLLKEFELPNDNALGYSKGAIIGGKNKKARSILGMIHSKIHSNTIVMWGFSSSIHIWNPYFSIMNPYQASYKGHSGIIKDCQFLVSSSCCVSIDNKRSLRIWNIKTLDTAQVLNLEQKAPMLSRVLVFSNDSIVVAGKKLIYLNNVEAENKMKFLEDAYPIYTHFNDYFKVFVVVTKFDVRIFNWTQGQLIEVFTNVLEDFKAYTPIITCYHEGPRTRKLYIGDNTGNVRQYNMKNFEFIKNVNNLEEERHKISSYKEMLSQGKFVTNSKKLKKKSGKSLSDITSFLYLHDENMLIVGTSDSVIKFYDESDSEEHSLLKFFIGGHKNSAICSLGYQNNINYLASGSENGIVTLWDVGKGKFESSYELHSDKITGLKFLEYYSILLSSSMDGTIVAWGLRHIKNEFRNQCIFKLLLFDYDASPISGRKIYSRLDQLVPITGIEARCGVEKLVFKDLISNEKMDRKIAGAKRMGQGNIYDSFQPTDASGEDSYVGIEKSKIDEAQREKENSGYKKGLTGFHDMSSIDPTSDDYAFPSGNLQTRGNIFTKEATTHKKSHHKKSMNRDLSSNRRKGAIDLEIKQDKLLSGLVANSRKVSEFDVEKILTYSRDSNVMKQQKSFFTKKGSIQFHQQLSIQKFREMWEKNITSYFKEYPRAYLYITDSKGQVHYSELSLFLEFYGIKPKVVSIKNEREDKIRRPENLNVENQSISQIEALKINTRKLPEMYDYFLSVNAFTQSPIKSHTGPINSIVLNERERIIITSGRDSFVKVWGFDGVQYGSFSIMGDKMKGLPSKKPKKQVTIKKPIPESENSNPHFWNFKINLLSVVDNDFEEVFHNLEMIEGRKYSRIEQDKVKNDYLIKTYINPYLEKLNRKKIIPESQKTREYYDRFLKRIRKKHENLSMDELLKANNLYTQNTKIILPKLKNYQLYDVDKTNLLSMTTKGQKLMRNFKNIDNRIMMEEIDAQEERQRERKKILEEQRQNYVINIGNSEDGKSTVSYPYSPALDEKLLNFGMKHHQLNKRNARHSNEGIVPLGSQVKGILTPQIRRKVKSFAAKNSKKALNANIDYGYTPDETTNLMDPKKRIARNSSIIVRKVKMKSSLASISKISSKGEGEELSETNLVDKFNSSLSINQAKFEKENLMGINNSNNSMNDPPIKRTSSQKNRTMILNRFKSVAKKANQKRRTTVGGFRRSKKNYGSNMNQTARPRLKKDKSFSTMSYRRKQIIHQKSLGALAKHRESKPKFMNRDLPENHIKVSRTISTQYGSFINKMRYLRERDAKKLSAINMTKLRKKSNLKMGFGQRFKKRSEFPHRVMLKIKKRLEMDATKITSDI